MYERHTNIDEQTSILGNKIWSVPRLIFLTRDFEVMNIPLKFLNVSNFYNNLSMRQLAGHAKAINDADLSHPIILDEDGDIMDGRHRIMKTMIEGVETIKAVRFESNPLPCRYTEE